MTEHRWERNLLALERVDQRGKRHPEVPWFPKCIRCGCLAAPSGGGVIYRATPRDEWTTTAPACVTSEAAS